jgi:hypothetical protein
MLKGGLTPASKKYNSPRIHNQSILPTPPPPPPPPTTTRQLVSTVSNNPTNDDLLLSYICNLTRQQNELQSNFLKIEATLSKLLQSIEMNEVGGASVEGGSHHNSKKRKRQEITNYGFTPGMEPTKEQIQDYIENQTAVLFKSFTEKDISESSYPHLHTIR